MTIYTPTLTLINNGLKTAEAFLDQLIAKNFHIAKTDPDDTRIYNEIVQNIADIATKLQRIAPQ